MSTLKRRREESLTLSALRLSDGHRIPRIGYGTGGVPADMAEDLVSAAIKTGYRHIDTAVIYGNEAEVGAAVRKCGIARQSLFVTTKCWPDRFGRADTIASFDESLERLGLNYVDLYLLHWPAPDNDQYVDSWRALIDLRQEGRIKSIGVSNFYPGQIERISGETGVSPALNQIELHPYYQREAEQRFHRDHGIATSGWSPLRRGKCLDDPIIMSIAAKHGCTAAQVALAYLVAIDVIIIPRSRSAERLAENFHIANIELDIGDKMQVAALDKGIAGRLGEDPDFSQ